MPGGKRLNDFAWGRYWEFRTKYKERLLEANNFGSFGGKYCSIMAFVVVWGHCCKLGCSHARIVAYPWTAT